MKKIRICEISLLSIILTACGSAAPAAPQNAAEGGENVPAPEGQGFVPQEVMIIPDDPAEFVFEPFTPIDNDQCSVTVSALDPSMGFAIEYELENKSPDMNYIFELESVAVNGVNTYGHMYTPVPAGQKTTGKTELGYGLKEEGVGKYTDIEITMVVRTEMYSEEPVARETFHVYPYGEDKVEKYVREPKETDRILSENDTFRCTLNQLAAMNESPYAPSQTVMVGLFVENKTDSTIRFQITDFSINDYMFDTGIMKTIGPEHCAFVNLYVSKDELEFNEIETVEEVEFKLQLMDSDGYEELYSEMITLNP